MAHGGHWWTACPTKPKVTITIRQAVDEENQAPAPPLKAQSSSALVSPNIIEWQTSLQEIIYKYI